MIYLCALPFCPGSLSLAWIHNEICEQHEQNCRKTSIFSYFFSLFSPPPNFQPAPKYLLQTRSIGRTPWLALFQPSLSLLYIFSALFLQSLCCCISKYVTALYAEILPLMYVIAQLMEFRYRGESFTFTQLFSVSPNKIQKERGREEKKILTLMKPS